MRPDATINGFLVEQMAEPGMEFVVGAKRDPDWGVVVVAGLGGIWLEILRDQVLFPAGINDNVIRGKLMQLSAAPILTGARGKSALDLDALIDVIRRVSDVMEANPMIAELDLNPVVVYRNGDGAMILDAHIVAI
jgi:hypothetical protein